nr:ABC transporter permease [uncultured Chitinophaga sp.]
MFKHNLRIIYRNFKKDKLTFVINLLGLSVGLACSLLIFLWVKDELEFDKYNDNDSRIVRVMSNYHNSDNIDTQEGTPGLLAESLAREIPEVQYAVASFYDDEKNLLTAGENNIKAPGRYVGKDFFKIFSYTLLQGDKNQVLSNNNSIVLSEGLAKKLFKTTENVIGKVVEFQRKKPFVVSGIYKDVPVNSTDQFEFLLPYEWYKAEHDWTLHWGNTGPSTIVLLKEGASLDQFNAKIENFVKNKFSYSPVTLFATQFSRGYLYKNYVNGVQSGGRIEYVRLFSLVAVFILLIACINFMNLSTAKASLKAKEIGIRKVMGAERRTFIIQYLSESVLIAFLSLLVAIIITVLLLPLFNSVSGKHIGLHFNWSTLVIVPGIALFTGLVSGIYPALYLPRFTPIAALKGTIRSSVGELWARKGLVCFQFVISIVLITGVWIIYRQIQFVQTRNLGYDRANVIYFSEEGRVEQHPESFLSLVKTIPGVVNASVAGYEIGSVPCTYGIEWPGKDKHDANCFQQIAAGYDLIETLGIKMKEGRSFSRNYGQDTSAVVLNEAAVKIMGIKDPIGKRIRLWEKEVEIIGITKNFYLESVRQDIKPVFFWLKPSSTWSVMLKMQPGKETAVLSELTRMYKDFNPGFELEYKFLNEAYKAQYIGESHVSALSKYFAGLAIFISCLGLFGLAIFTTQRRRKEIGVRKTLGASSLNVVYILTSEFTKIVLISILIALPVSFLLARQWLNGFSLRIDLKLWYFAGAGLLALFISWLTVGVQAIKAASLNPKDCLKDL